VALAVVENTPPEPSTQPPRNRVDQHAACDANAPRHARDLRIFTHLARQHDPKSLDNIKHNDPGRKEDLSLRDQQNGVWEKDEERGLATLILSEI
jgi:hypothetical protein